MATSDCCSSSSSSPSSPRLPPFRDRFADFTEPLRTQIIETSTKLIVEYYLKLTANKIQRHGQYRCRGCNETLRRTVKAAEDAGLAVDEEYTSMAAKIRKPWDVELAELWDRVKRRKDDDDDGGDERELKKGRVSVLEEEEEDVEDFDDFNDGEVLEIYD